MKPVHQTIFGDNGNCLQACIASLLELPLDDVPHFLECPPGRDPEKYSYFRALEQFCNGFDLQPVAKQSGTFCPYDAYYLGWGVSPRGLQHSVVMKNGEIVFDPHPDGGGIEPEMDVFFYRRFGD